MNFRRRSILFTKAGFYLQVRLSAALELAIHLGYADPNTLRATPEHHFGGPSIPVLPAFRAATAAAVAAAAADGIPTAAVAAVLVRGHCCGQALQLPFTLGDFHHRRRLTSLHLNSKVHLPFSGGRGQVQSYLVGALPLSLSLSLVFNSQWDLRPRLEWKPTVVQKKRTRISTLVKSFKEHGYPSERCLSRARTRRTNHPARGLGATLRGAAGRRGARSRILRLGTWGKDGGPQPGSPGAHGLTSGLGVGPAALPLLLFRILRRKGRSGLARRFPPQPRPEPEGSRAARGGSGRRRWAGRGLRGR